MKAWRHRPVAMVGQKLAHRYPKWTHIDLNRNKNLYLYRKVNEAIVLGKTDNGNWYEQSRTDLESNKALNRYAREIISIVPDDQPIEVAVLGCGGASIPQELCFHYPLANCTVVDKEEDSLEIGKYLMGDKVNDVKWIHEYAGKYISNTEQKFDIIVNDIFDVCLGMIPDWTISDEFLKNILSVLNDGGKYVQNIIARNFGDHCAALNSVFENVDVKTSHEIPLLLRNVIFECSQPRLKHRFPDHPDF